MLNRCSNGCIVKYSGKIWAVHNNDLHYVKTFSGKNKVDRTLKLTIIPYLDTIRCERNDFDVMWCDARRFGWIVGSLKRQCFDNVHPNYCYWIDINSICALYWYGRIGNGQYEITISRWTGQQKWRSFWCAHFISWHWGWSFHLVNAQIKLNLQNPSIQWMRWSRAKSFSYSSVFAFICCLRLTSTRNGLALASFDWI